MNLHSGGQKCQEIQWRETSPWHVNANKGLGRVISAIFGDKDDDDRKSGT